MKKSARGKFAHSLDELAELFQVNRNTIKKWLNEGAPRRVEGNYDIAGWRIWVTANKAHGGAEDTKAGWEKLKLQQVVRRLKRENDEDDNLLVRAADVARDSEALASHIKAEMIAAIGSELGIEAERIARDIGTTALKRLEEKPGG
jgi:phage terminase Nu1 subunit (DNA packaging protein)